MNPNEIRAVNARARVERINEAMAELDSGSSQTPPAAPRAESRAQRDPFEHVPDAGNYLHPMVKPGTHTVPRHRWPDQVDADRAALTGSSADSERYEQFRRDQMLVVDTASKLATKAAANDSDALTVLAKADPYRADKATQGTSLFPPANADEERERALALRELLLSIPGGYDLRWSPTGTFMKDAGGNSAQEFVYVVIRVNSQGITLPQYSGAIVGAERVARELATEHYAQQAKLAQLAKTPYQPLVRVGAVQVADEQGNFPTEAQQAASAQQAEINALRERLAALERGSS